MVRRRLTCALCCRRPVLRTSPRDASRISLVASTFRSASESDAVWERLLPADYKEIISRSDDPGSIPWQFATELAGVKSQLDYLHQCLPDTFTLRFERAVCLKRCRWKVWEQPYVRNSF